MGHSVRAFPGEFLLWNGSFSDSKFLNGVIGERPFGSHRWEQNVANKGGIRWQVWKGSMWPNISTDTFLGTCAPLPSSFSSSDISKRRFCLMWMHVRPNHAGGGDHIIIHKFFMCRLTSAVCSARRGCCKPNLKNTGGHPPLQLRIFSLIF